MNKKQLITLYLIIVCLYPSIVGAVTFDDMLMHHPNSKKPFWGYVYKNIKWVSHTPVGDEPEEEEADNRSQIDIGKVDLDGDKKAETIKVIWSHGVTEHNLEIELYKDGEFKELIDKFSPIAGIQSNFKLEDIDKDGKLELIIWGGLWDFRMEGEEGVVGDAYEGHSDPHRYVVATYKLIKGNEFRQDQYSLWDVYTTKKKYEPFCKEMPKE